MLHLIRNTFRYASKADWDELARDLKPVYRAPSEQAASERFDELEAKWGETYPAITKLWQNAWADFVPFLAYSPEIRTVIYSTDEIVTDEIVKSSLWGSGVASALRGLRRRVLVVRRGLVPDRVAV